MRPFNNSALLGLCIAIFLVACNTLTGGPTATVDYDHSYDFSSVHKIAIQPIPKDTLATMMISDAQIDRINKALITELQLRGFRVVTVNAEADMFLSWQYVPEENLEVATYDPATQPISQGTLYVNMIDPLLLQSKWRATFHSDLRDQPETDQAVQYRQEAAEAILAQFPPKPGVR